MNVTRIRVGVYRLELKPDEELDIQGIASHAECSVEEIIPELLDTGINAEPVSENDEE